MKRIDSVNARPNQNGVGKKGFHDNNDISGQDATYLTPSWCNTVQEELANAIEGFGQPLDPNNNAQLLSILKPIAEQSSDLEIRVSLLENFVENSVDFFYPVGIIVDFGIFNIDPNVRFVGTTWVRHGEGLASVGYSSQSSAESWTKTVGNTFGEYKHQLTVDELASHNHAVSEAGGVNGGALSVDLNSNKDSITSSVVQHTGGDQPHNNVQPSIVDARWRRTA